MLKCHYLNRNIKVKNLKYQVRFNMQCYLKKAGKIKGFKKLPNNRTIYLIEFLNQNRIWFAIKEFEEYRT